MEDSIAIAELREENEDIPNIGGVHEPRMPIVREVMPPQIVQTNKTKALCNQEPVSRQAASTPHDSSQGSGFHKTPNSTSEPRTDNPIISETPDEDNEEAATEGDNPPVSLTEPDALLGWSCSYVSTAEINRHTLEREVYLISEDDQPPELVFLKPMHKYLVLPNRNIDDETDSTTEVLFQYDSRNEMAVSVIQRTHNILTRDEALANAEACRVSMIKEFHRWNKHNAWRRMPLSQSRNLLKSKWVLKWKQIEGSKQIKSRLVAQGFLDKQDTVTFSGTTSRWGQRILIAVATQMEWSLVSADVSEAFLRGITFQELSEYDKSSPMRVVEIELPEGTAELLRTLPGMEGYDPKTECLSMLKPGFGLRDAPRLWNMALLRVLNEGGLHRCQTDRQLFVKHESAELVLLVSTHVDDLKITGKPSEIKSLLSLLTKHFDELRLSTDNFEHLGLKHVRRDDGTRAISQEHYIKELNPIPECDLKNHRNEPVNEAMKTQFASLLGGLAWI